MNMRPNLLSGTSLPINFSTWNHTNQSMGSDNNFNTHINRALTRLKSVCITLGNVESSRLKEANHFYHPIGSSQNDAYALSDEHQVWIQIGSKLMTEYPISSVTEALYQLKKTVGNSFQMYARWYRTHRYIIGIACEKISGAGFTGMNTKAGDLLTLHFRDCSLDGTAKTTPTRVYCALHYDAVLNIRDSGIELLE